MVLTEEERKERKRISNKKYRESENGQKKAQLYYKNNEERKEKKRIRDKKYKEINKKETLKNLWKGRGLNMENFEEIYERYTMAIFCDICECVLEGIGRNKKCMDHCHLTGEFRNVVCFYCNIHICK